MKEDVPRDALGRRLRVHDWDAVLDAWARGASSARIAADHGATSSAVAHIVGAARERGDPRAVMRGRGSNLRGKRAGWHADAEARAHRGEATSVIAKALGKKHATVAVVVRRVRGEVEDWQAALLRDLPGLFEQHLTMTAVARAAKRSDETVAKLLAMLPAAEQARLRALRPKSVPPRRQPSLRPLEEKPRRISVPPKVVAPKPPPRQRVAPVSPPPPPPKLQPTAFRVVEDTTHGEVERVRSLLRHGKDVDDITTKLPMREVYRIRGEVREEMRAERQGKAA